MGKRALALSITSLFVFWDLPFRRRWHGPLFFLLISNTYGLFLFPTCCQLQRIKSTGRMCCTGQTSRRAWKGRGFDVSLG